MASDQLPETLRVVHVPQMAEFMDENISGKVRRQEQQLLIKADGTAGRAAGPAGLLVADYGSGEFEACLISELVEPGHQVGMGLAPGPTA